MVLDKIDLINFRNYSAVTFAPVSGANFFIGENGQGKTNFIEAIYLLSKGLSFRPVITGSLIKEQSNNINLAGSSISAVVNNKNFRDSIKVVLNPKKKIFLNEKASTSQKTQQKLPLILFSPESLLAIKEGPELRRELVDEFLLTFEPSAGQLIHQYRRLIRQKNLVLKQIKQNKITKSSGLEILFSLRPSFLQLATQLTQSRKEALKVLHPYLVETLKNIFFKQNVDISVDYKTSNGLRLNDLTEQETFSLFQRREEELVEREIQSGNSLVGPHKHDVQFLINQKDARYFCSQGQQRAVILSFKMAQIMYHYQAYNNYPILLLDDVLSELDEEKRVTLIHFLANIKSQIFITSTEVPVNNLKDLDAALYRVHQGTITHIS